MNLQVRRAVRPELPPDEQPSFARDVLEGLNAEPKWLSAKYFYDVEGSRLFELITRLPEYYPTRTELRILKENAAAIAALIPDGAALVEFGSGANTKVRILLQAAPEISTYVPVDISAEFLAEEASTLQRDFPRLSVLPVAADFTRPFDLPLVVRARPRVGFFPGSTIGNFEPEDAEAFLRHAARILGRGACLIVGVDLVKDTQILHAAYNDAEGITARFNLNLLARINRELGADFDLASFEHKAFYNSEFRRIEMHLVSNRRQRVLLDGNAIEFEPGKTIHTENSYKYTLSGFSELARRAGWTPRAAWTDPDHYFSVHALALPEDLVLE
jgi:dimethylhistidine N-methyltransferase